MHWLGPPEIEDPLDPRILDRLFNETPELVARSLLRAAEADGMRRQRREAWDGWLRLLRDRKERIQAQRCIDGKATAAEMLWWGTAADWFIFRLRLAGAAHFYGWSEWRFGNWRG